MISVAIAAPTLALRAGLAALLNSNSQIEVTIQAAALPELLPLPVDVRVLVLAVGADLQPDAELLASLHEVAVLFLVEGSIELAGLVSGLQSRPWGVLMEDISAEELHAAVLALSEGLIVGTPALLGQEMTRLFSIRQDLQRTSATGEADLEIVERLSERETQVLQLLARGLSNKQIAVGLKISEHTVKFHVSAIYQKLGAASRTEAVRLGVRQGLVVL